MRVGHYTGKYSRLRSKRDLHQMARAIQAWWAGDEGWPRKQATTPFGAPCWVDFP